MTARDRWLDVKTDGTIVLLSENDGYTYLNRGPQREERVVTEAELKVKYPRLHARYLAIRGK
jgi:hypothetical protein